MIGHAFAIAMSDEADPLYSLGLCVGSGEPTRERSVFHTNQDTGWVWCRARDAENMHAMCAQILHHVRDVELGNVEQDAGADDKTRVLSDPLEECPVQEHNPEYYERVRRDADPDCTPDLAACDYAPYRALRVRAAGAV